VNLVALSGLSHLHCSKGARDAREAASLTNSEHTYPSRPLSTVVATMVAKPTSCPASAKGRRRAADRRHTPEMTIQVQQSAQGPLCSACAPVWPPDGSLVLGGILGVCATLHTPTPVSGTDLDEAPPPNEMLNVAVLDPFDFGLKLTCTVHFPPTATSAGHELTTANCA